MKLAEKMALIFYLFGALAMFAGAFVDKFYLIIAVVVYFIGISFDNISRV